MYALYPAYKGPIDLIPDPIPILDYPDDIILVPLGTALAILRRALPDVPSDRREKARTLEGKLFSKTAAAIVILVQLLVATAVALIYDGAPESPTS